MKYGGGAALVQNNNNNNNKNCSGAAFGSMAESSSSVAELGDLIDELLVEGCWLETTGGGGGSYNMIMNPSAASCDDLAQPQLPQYYLAASCDDDDDQMMMLQQESSSSEESFVVGKRWWIGPRGVPGGPSSSVKERLVVAVGYLKEYYYYYSAANNNNNNNNVLQVWVPPRRSSSGLHYHNHNHSHSHRLSMDDILHHEEEAVAFPNTNTNTNTNTNPNTNTSSSNNKYYVRFLRSYPPPRPHQYGSLALPVLERGTGACLGVLDILIHPNQHLHNTFNNNYHHRPHLLPLDNALEAVDYRSCHQNFIIPPPAVKVFEELYEAAVSEIVEVMTTVCKTQNLPLALTWAPCMQQAGKCCGGCVSTVESACFVGDLQILGFQEACSECHLLRGQGIVGTALTTTKPCFAIDITAFTKAEYPLSHHASLFGLHAALAIPLRSLYTGSAADFVLEFFLPKECHDGDEQKHLLNSLSILVQQACRTLHVATTTTTTDLLLDDEDFTLPPPTTTDHNHNKLQHLFAAQMEAEEAAKESSSSITTTSWIAHMMEAQGQQSKGKGVCVSMEYHQLEDPKEEFKVTTNWDATTNQSHHLNFSSSPDFGHIDHTSASASLGSGSADGGLDQQDSYAAAAAAASFGGRRSSSATSGGRKSGDKRRTKAEKTISLPVLRQYFAGSLKDAAKSIGVCPTTLKRICRQHGITRWPSRKIKKVGHSLKKLQLVIDSVQGAEGAIQIGSFYASFPELGSADFSSSSSPTTTARSNQPSKKAPPNALKSAAAASASCSSHTTATFGAGNHHHHHHQQEANNSTAVMMTMTESCDAAAAAAAAELQQEEEDTKHFTWSRGHGAFRVKATFVDEKIRFSLQPNWGFRDLQVEIARRFNLNDISNMDLRYLDDDGEWVLLACDADLHECKDIHTSSQTRTIRLSLFHPNTSFPSTSPPS